MDLFQTQTEEQRIHYLVGNILELLQAELDQERLDINAWGALTFDSQEAFKTYFLLSDNLRNNAPEAYAELQRFIKMNMSNQITSENTKKR